MSLKGEARDAGIPHDGGEETLLAPSQFGWVSWDVARGSVVCVPFPRRLIVARLQHQRMDIIGADPLP